jgi:hypothetical protein
LKLSVPHEIPLGNQLNRGVLTKTIMRVRMTTTRTKRTRICLGVRSDVGSRPCLVAMMTMEKKRR